MKTPVYTTVKPWRRYVLEVGNLENAAADGNTWGPATDARILANLLLPGIAERINEIEPPASEDDPEVHTAYFEGFDAAIAAVTELLGAS